MPVDGCVAHVLDRPGDDPEVGLGRGDVVEPTEEEHGRADGDDDRKGADSGQ